jgi:hypothetical protein
VVIPRLLVIVGLAPARRPGGARQRRSEASVSALPQESRDLARDPGGIS